MVLKVVPSLASAHLKFEIYLRGLQEAKIDFVSEIFIFFDLVVGPLKMFLLANSHDVWP